MKDHSASSGLAPIFEQWKDWYSSKLQTPTGDPFLTRAIVFLGEDWYAPSKLAREHLRYAPKFDWKTAIRCQLKDMKRQGYPGTPLLDGLRW